MRFTVRAMSEKGEVEGELNYDSFGQIEQAWLMGLISPHDEILEAGHTKWRRADTFPLLVNARRSGEQVWVGTWFVWVLALVAGATWAVTLFQDKQYVWAMVVSVVVAMVTMKISTDAAKRTKPHGNLKRK
jgi:hypothetical protein